LIDPALLARWQRSRQFGLAPDGRMPGAPHASGAQLARALEHQRELVAHARPVMEFLFEQVQGSDSMVILADPQGMLLQALGDASFADRARAWRCGRAPSGTSSGAAPMPSAPRWPKAARWSCTAASITWSATAS
jgi:transcriptional regulator of acetoin/glycerol metabolism